MCLCNQGANMYASQKESLYFGPDPCLQQLCAVCLEVPPLPSNLAVKGTTSNYQPQIIRCRELIFTEQDIIATPLLGQDRKVQIIMQQTLYKTGRLQARFNKMGIKAGKPMRVTPVDFKSCLIYTLLARMAPSWNKVGDYLIQGRDSITNPNKLNTLVVDINVTEDEMYLSLKADIIRLPPARLQDLDICRPVVNEFLSSRLDGTIPEYAIGRKWCHILPSMKKGQVVKVLHKIPIDSPFKTYKDIKRYWKNTYGYRLPESDEGMLYYQVYFKLIGEVLFTYPECCIRPREAVKLASVDPRPIQTAFFNDLHTKIPSICGRKMVFETQAKYTQSQLLGLSQVIDNEPNITSETPVSYQRFRQRPQFVTESTWLPSAHQQNITNQLGAYESRPPPDHQGSTALSQSSAVTHAQYPESQAEEDLDCSLIGPSQPQQGSKFKPSFSCRMPLAATKGPDNRNTTGVGAKKVPVFKAAKQTAVDRPKQDFTRFVKTLSQKFKEPIEEKTHNDYHSDTRGNPAFTGTPTSTKSKFSGSVDKQGKMAAIVSKLVPGTPNLHQKPTTPVKLLAARSPDQTLSSTVKDHSGINESGYYSSSTQQSGGNNIHRSGFLTQTPSSLSQSLFTLPDEDNFDLINMTDKSIRNNLSTPKRSLFSSNPMLTPIGTPLRQYSKGSPGSVKSSTPLHTPLRRYSNDSPGTFKSSTPLLTPLRQYSNGSPGSHKRKSKDFVGESTPKKPRAKPKIQDGINLEVLASNDQLFKVNTVTLMAWLRERGVPCKTKDKKGELEEKVRNCLNIKAGLLVEP